MNDNNSSQPLEIYDMSVNNPAAQSFLEKSAFLKFLIQQLRLLVDEEGNVKGSTSKYNSFVSQLNRVRLEMIEEKKQIKKDMDKFKAMLEDANQKRRTITQSIMQLTREKSSGELEQNEYHQRKYEQEMKRKSLGNQIQILNKNISIYNNLINLPVPSDEFSPILEEFRPPLEAEPPLEELDDDDMVLDTTAEGITFMGVLSADDIEKALTKRKIKTKQEAQAQSSISSTSNPRLNIITETGKQYYYTLTPPNTVRIGRASDTEIQIPSPAVSRYHAEIRHEETGIFIVDLESSNGTFVNDKMVIRRKIEPNDTITIGGTRLIFLP